MRKRARFELVRGDAGWFARFLAANGREVWRTSETYQRRAGAVNAIKSIAVVLYGDVTADGQGVTAGGWGAIGGAAADIAYVDERDTSTPEEPDNDVEPQLPLEVES